MRAGDTHFVTRRTLNQQNRFRPTRRLINIVGYFLAVFANERGIKLTAVCFLGDHEHMLGTDGRACMPELFRDLHSFVARQINATFGETGPVWDKRQTNVVDPIQAEDIIDTIAYIMANPVKHGLVKYAKNHPGLRCRWPCKPRRFKRPTGFLNPKAMRDGKPRWPEYAVLEMFPPDVDMPENELALAISQACRVKEAEFRAVIEQDSERDFMGARKVRALPRSHCFKGDDKPGPVPRIKCADPEVRREARRERCEWLRDYNKKFAEWRGGDRNTVFPYGTYKMRLVHSATIAPAPT